MPDLERIQQLTPGTVSQQWYEAGAAIDPGTVTIGITRADGTELVAAGTATNGSGTSARTFNLTTTHTTLLDTLKLTWTSTNKGTLVSYLEVVGGFLFSIAEARTLRPLDNTTTYTTAMIVAMRNRVEQALEEACGVAFVPRYALESLLCDYPLMVSNPRVRVVRSATDGTTPLTQDQLDDLTITGRTIYGLPWVPYIYTSWSGARFNVTVGYEHGYAYSPERVRRAALLLAKSWLVSGPIDDRASTFNAGADGGTYSLQTPGVRGSIFGLPEVDVVVQEYGYRVAAP